MYDAISRNFRGFLHLQNGTHVHGRDRFDIEAQSAGTLCNDRISNKDTALPGVVPKGTVGAFRLSFESLSMAEAAEVSLDKPSCRAQRL